MIRTMKTATICLRFRERDECGWCRPVCLANFGGDLIDMIMMTMNIIEGKYISDTKANHRFTNFALTFVFCMNRIKTKL